TTEKKESEPRITRTIKTTTTETKPNQQPSTTIKTETVVITEKEKKIDTRIQSGLSLTSTSKTEKLTAQDKKDLELAKRSPSEKAAATATTAAAPTGDPITGLPNQTPGFIDLRDGRAEAQQIADESRRVKGYEDSVVLVMNMDTLQIVPGQIVALSKRVFPEAFATEKRVGGVQHDFGAGTTTLQLYSPQAQLPAGSGSAIAPAAGATQLATPSGPPGQFRFPIPSGATSIGDGFGTRPGRPPGYRHTILDVTAPTGTICIAMADGVVSDIRPNNGGAGNMLVIDYGGGYQSIYMHGMPGQFALVPKGAQVKQGQPVFKVGSTGRSSGPHLHLKFTLNGTYCLLSKVGIDVLKMGLPVRRYSPNCTAY
ncbi:MAG TPA: M23 family metallopeptidase, partial [Allocoleopsis sp.]